MKAGCSERMDRCKVTFSYSTGLFTDDVSPVVRNEGDVTDCMLNLNGYHEKRVPPQRGKNMKTVKTGSSALA